MRRLLLFSLLLLLLSSPAYAMTTSDCFDCHSDEDLVKTVGGSDLSLYVDEEVFTSSIHGDLDCTDCHSDVADVEDEHAEELEEVACSDCHDDAADDLLQSAHAAGNSRVAQDLPGCSQCHGKHDILPGDNVRSRIFELNIPATCGECHASEEITSRHPNLSSEVSSEYEKGMHGIVLFKSGMIFSAVCNDCHGSHNILSAADERSPVHRTRINDTCSSCHAGIVDVYLASIHGKNFAGGSEEAPTCVSCHGTHRIDRAMDKEFLITVTERCSECHEEKSDTFKNTYHGQVTGLGYSEAAQCPDCHGAHEILPSEDPASMINPDNLQATCGACHPGANSNFVKYLPHADYHDKENYPGLYYLYLSMVLLLAGVFIFFGIHTALWLIRAQIEVRSERKR